MNKNSNNKLTEIEVDKILARYGYNRLEPYKSNMEPFRCEKDGYWFNIRLGNLQKGEKPSKFGISNPFLSHNFQAILDKKNSEAKYISHKIVTKKHRKRVLVTLQCKCGTLFIKDGSQLDSPKINLLCPICYKEHKKRVHRNHKGDMIKLFEQRGYKVIEVPNVCDVSTLWLIENQDGYRGYLSYNKLQQGRELSIYGNNNYNLRIYNLNVFLQSMGSDSKALKMVDREHVLIECECGQTFECLYYKPFSVGRVYCPQCNQRVSKFALAISKFLESQDILFKREFIINSCRDKLPLPFDFWLKDYNALIEVDGQQHFEAIDCWGGEQGLQLTKLHDKIKTEYCQQWKIPLLRLSYLEIQDDSYKDKIIQFIQSIKD